MFILNIEGRTIVEIHIILIDTQDQGCCTVINRHTIFVFLSEQYKIHYQTSSGKQFLRLLSLMDTKNGKRIVLQFSHVIDTVHMLLFTFQR